MGIAEIEFYLLLEIQASFFQAYGFFKIEDFENNFFFKIQIIGIKEKCIGWFLVYLFQGVVFIISAKRMCKCDYVKNPIGTF